MPDNIFDSILKQNLDVLTIFIVIIASALLGLVLSGAYLLIKRKDGYAVDFPLTLIILPVIVAMIIMLVGNNTARAFSLAGIFALTRFRSEPKDTIDITYIFICVAIGLANGLGYIGYAVLFTIIIILILIALYFSKFGAPSLRIMNLKIVIPEDINYENLFDETIKLYCLEYRLKKVRTTDFGTMFELTYTIKMKKDADQKKFIDELRVKNGNLPITLTVKRFE